MTTQRRQYSAPFKAKAALEVLKGHRTLNEIASDLGVHPTQLSAWKKQLLDELPRVFCDKRAKDSKEQEALQERLCQQIGQLQVELDWLKKKSRQLG